MCKKVNIPILGVVENMSWFVDSAGVRHELFGKGGGQAVAEFAEAPLLGQVPLDPSVREWGDKGTPVVQAAPVERASRRRSSRSPSVVDRRLRGRAPGRRRSAGPSSIAAAGPAARSACPSPNKVRVAASTAPSAAPAATRASGHSACASCLLRS